MLNSVMACTQEKNDNLSTINLNLKEITIVPFLTKQNEFIYVDKISFKPVINQHFQTATTFTPTGFAVVSNEKNEYAVVNETGEIIMNYSPYGIDLNVINGLTFYKKNLEYEKKMPFYKWDWNIMGSGIKKEQTYHKTEIGILESKQILLDKDIPYLEDNFYLNFIALDENHIFWNETLYQIKNKKLYKIETNIAELLENKKYLKNTNNSFSMYELNKKKPILNGLIGVDKMLILFNKDKIVLNDINKERFAPEVPKTLLDSKNNVYPFPQYDKVFPQKIKKATTAQIDFLRKTTLIYSINNSPYFLLGIFNYDHNVWAYDWLYVDVEGNMLDALESTYNFKVLDQVGNLVWPDRKMIFPDELNTEKWKFGKINSYEGMHNLYIIPIENKKEIRTKGLWNSHTKAWEIKPEYYNISVLDIEQGIYALQKEENGLFMLYDNKSKKMVSSKKYLAVNSNGLVSIKENDDETIYYYIDIYSGKEYKED